jgi:integrase
MSPRPFGFIRTRTGRASPYRAGFNPPDGGPEVSKSFATEDEAEVWLAEQHVAIARGAFVDPSGGRTLLADYWAVWLAERPLRPSSRQTYELHGRKHILPAFGHRPLASLRHNEIQAWVNRLPVGPRTAKTILAVFQSCLRSAVVDDLIPKSVAVGVSAPRARRRRLTVPTAEEVEALAEAMYEPYRVVVHLAAEAGLRQGEVLGLRVEDLDLLGRRLHVARQAQTVRGQGVLLDQPPKSDAGYRTVPLAPDTVEVIAWHLAQHPARAGLVVTSSAGTPVRRSVFNEAWAKAKNRADLARPLRFHDLRHRYASVLIAEGLDALTVKTLMGHASITETFDTYGHLFPDQSERAAEAIATSLHGVSRPKPRPKEGTSPAQGA